MNKDYKNLAHFIYGWKREDVKTQNRMIDWLLLFAYYKAYRQQPIIETVQCDEEIADKVSKLRVLGYGTGCVNTMCAGVSTGVCHAPIVQQVSDTPSSRASRLRFATAWQARRYVTVFRIPCASTPPMLRG